MIELSSCYWIPKARFTPVLRDRLTVEVTDLAGEVTEVECFREDRKGFVGVPRVIGADLFAGERVQDVMADGVGVRFPKQVALRPEQEPLVERILQLRDDGETDFIVKAATGKGKTVCALAVAARMGTATVVVVDQENLMEQWVARAKEHLGLRDDQIGIVQGSRVEFAGKALVICMIQTLVRKVLPQEFYNRFGLAVFDESHTTGAPTFSRVLMMFPARLRIGLSATPMRRDALSKAIAWNLGTIQAELTDKPGKASVYILESFGVYSWRANNAKVTGRYISELAEDGLRNLRIVDAIDWLYDSGRDILVLGERVEHLCNVMALARAYGIPAEAMGLYAKNRMVYRYEKDPRPRRLPVGYEKGTEYTPVRYVAVQKTVPKKEREHALAHKRIVFATYAVFKKGMDCPRLSGGIDITPRSEATQMYGRILRTVPGKLRPIWFTVSDVNSFRSLYQLNARLGDYIKSNAEVYLWHATKGRKPLEHREYRQDLRDRILDLRETRIGTQLDGTSMLLTPSMQIRSDD